MQGGTSGKIFESRGIVEHGVRNVPHHLRASVETRLQAGANASQTLLATFFFSGLLDIRIVLEGFVHFRNPNWRTSRQAGTEGGDDGPPTGILISHVNHRSVLYIGSPWARFREKS